MGKKGWILVVVAFAFSFVVGCSSETLPVPTAKVEKAMSKAEIDAELIHRQTEARNKEFKKAADDKAAAIQEVKAAFYVSFGDEGPITPITGKPKWFKKAKGEKSNPFAIVKAQQPIFLGMRLAFSYFDPKYVHSFGRVLEWKEVHFPEEDARKNYREAGSILAKNLFATLRCSREEREQAGKFGRGEGSMEFSDGVRILDYAIEILTEIDVDPKVDLRKIALGVHKEKITRWRKELAGRPDSADVQGLLYGAVSDAIDGWHFSPKELGLTKSERALLKKNS